MHRKFTFDSLHEADLHVDAVYEFVSVLLTAPAGLPPSRFAATAVALGAPSASLTPRLPSLLPIGSLFRIAHRPQLLYLCEI